MLMVAAKFVLGLLWSAHRDVCLGARLKRFHMDHFMFNRTIHLLATLPSPVRFMVYAVGGQDLLAGFTLGHRLEYRRPLAQAVSAALARRRSAPRSARSFRCDDRLCMGLLEDRLQRTPDEF